MSQTHYHSQVIAHGPGLPGAVDVRAPELDRSVARLGEQVADLARQAAPLFGRAYVARRTGEVNDAVQAVETRFAEWRTGYERERRGRLGLNAAEDYGRAWSGFADEAVKEFESSGYEVFGDMLRQRLGERGAYAARDGLAWQARQEEAWQASQTEAQADGFFRDVAADPYDVDRIVMEREALKGSMAARHPGVDLGAKFGEVDERTVRAMADSLLARGDADGVRRLFAQPVAARGGPKPGSVSERNLSVWNYGNVKNADGSFAAYASRRDGLLAMAGRFLRYHNAPERGWHARTLREVMSIYAPPSENNTGKYVETLAGWMGVDPDAELDFDDPGTLAGFIRHVPRYEHGQFVSIDPEEAREAAALALAGARPQTVGAAPASGRGTGGALADRQSVLSPKEMQSYLARADAMERQRLEAARGEMRAGMENYIQASQDGHVMDLPYSHAQVVSAFGESEGARVWAQLAGARDLALDMSAALGMTDAELDGLLASRAPHPESPTYAAEADSHARLVRGVAALRKRRADDPALYLCQTNEEAGQARQKFLRGMTPATTSAYMGALRSGLAALALDAASPLPKADAEAISSWLMRSDNPAAAARQLGECFGRDLPAVMRSVSTSLSADAALLAGMDEDAARLVTRALRDKDFEKNHLALFKSDVARSDFESAVRDLCDQTARTFLGGRNSDLPLAINRQTRLLALQYMASLGLDADKAVEQAHAKIIGERYVIMENHLPARAGAIFGKGDPAPGCRIPRQHNGRQLDADAIMTALAQILNNPPVQELSRRQIPGVDNARLDQAYAKLLRDNAYWLTDGDESGAVLYLGGQAVRKTDGQPYRLDWNTLEQMQETTESDDDEW